MSSEQQRGISVVVADDDEGLAQGWAAEIRKNPQVTAESLSSGDFAQSVTGLMDRQRRFRAAQNFENDERLPIEDCDVLIVDFDLIDLKDFPNLTAHTVAYLASNFTDIPLIGILNLYRKGDFDLTLGPRTDVRADLHLRSSHVGTPGLWSDHRDDYHPWSWPLVSKEVELWPERISEAGKILNQGVLDWLDLDQDAIPESALDILGQASGKLADLTMIQWITNAPCALEGKDLEAFGANRDSLNDAFKARILTRAMKRWLDLQVLPAQYPLCDLPHAYLRLPRMFKNGNTARLLDCITRLDLNHDALRDLLQRDVREYVWRRNNWLSRPAIHWARLMNDSGKLQHLFELEFDQGTSDLVFLEDCSKFGPLSDAHRFRADFDVSDNVRFIKKLPNIQYFPAARLAE